MKFVRWFMVLAGLFALLLGGLDPGALNGYKDNPKPTATPTARRGKAPIVTRRIGKNKMPIYIASGADQPGANQSFTGSGDSYLGVTASSWHIEYNGAGLWLFGEGSYNIYSKAGVSGTVPTGLYDLGPMGGGTVPPTVTLDSGGPPLAPLAPDHFTATDYTDGTATIETVAETPLPDLADSLSLYSNVSEDDTLDISGWDLIADEVAAGATVAMEFPENVYRQLMWVAVNDAGQTEGPRILLWTGLSIDAVDVRTPPPPDVSNVTARTFDVPRPSDLPASFLEIIAASEADDDYWTDVTTANRFGEGVYGFPAWAPGVTRTLPSGTVQLTPDTAQKARWWNDPGGEAPQVLGPITTFTTSPLTTTPPAPVVTGHTDSDPTTATATAPATLPEDLVSLALYLQSVPGSYVLIASGIVGGGTVDLTGLVVDQSYNARWRGFNADGDYADGPATPFTPHAGGVTPTGAPDAPGEVDDTDVTDTSITIEMPPLPARADALRLLYRLHSGTDADYVIAPGGDALAGSSSLVVTGLTLSTKYRFKPVAVNAFGATDGPVHDTRTEAVPPTATAPGTPAAPTLHSKTSTSARIIQSAWPAGTTRLDLYKGGIFLHSYLTPTEAPYNDTGLTSRTTYAYTVVAHNGTGDSAASPALNVTLISARLTITIDVPAPAATLTGITTIGFTLADPGPLGACPTPNITVRLGGLPVDVTALTDATPDLTIPATVHGRNTTYTLKVDTKLYPQGSQELEVAGLGTDCLEAVATVAVTLDNTLAHGVRFNTEQYLFPAAAGYQWAGLVASLEKRALSVGPEQWWWIQARVATDMTPVSNAVGALPLFPLADPGDQAAWQTEFDAMQPLTPKLGQYYAALGVRPETQQISYELPLGTLNFPGQALVVRYRWEPVERISWFTPQLLEDLEAVEYDFVAKIQLYATGKHFVLALRDDGAASGLLSFDGTDLVEVARFAGDVRDACAIGSKIYAITDDHQISVYDLDSGDVRLLLTIPGEARLYSLINAVTVTVANNPVTRPILVCVGEDDSTGYDLTFESPQLVWTLPAVVTLAGVANGNLGLAVGPDLYLSAGGTAAPVLTHTFNADISAIWRAGEGLNNGHIWLQSAAAGWRDAANRPGAIAALMGFNGAAGRERAIAATADEPALFEQVEDTGGSAWILGRTLEAPAESDSVIAGVTALQQWVRATDDALLIGARVSAGTALLGMLERSQLSEADGAFQASDITFINLDGIPGLVPA